MFTASLNPSLYAVPAKLPTPAALELWLQNPLLRDAHPALLDERKEQWPGWDQKERFMLLCRLKGHRDKLKAAGVATHPDDLSQKELMAFLDANQALLDDREEWASVRAFAFILHSRERAWYQDFLKEIFRRRSEQMQSAA